MTGINGIAPWSSPRRNPPPTCEVDGCDRPYVARGLCRTHYSRLYRGKPVGTDELQRNPDAPCRLDDCERPARMWGYCTLHGQRFRVHGDPHALGWGKTSDDTTTLLYRLWNSDGVLLYVGVTINIERRFTQHRKSQPWWGDVATYAAQSFPTRSGAFADEASVVAAEMPRHNKKLRATA